MVRFNNSCIFTFYSALCVLPLVAADGRPGFLQKRDGGVGASAEDYAPIRLFVDKKCDKRQQATLKQAWQEASWLVKTVYLTDKNPQFDSPAAHRYWFGDDYNKVGKAPDGAWRDWKKQFTSDWDRLYWLFYGNAPDSAKDSPGGNFGSGYIYFHCDWDNNDKYYCNENQPCCQDGVHMQTWDNLGWFWDDHVTIFCPRFWEITWEDRSLVRLLNYWNVFPPTAKMDINNFHPSLGGIMLHEATHYERLGLWPRGHDWSNGPLNTTRLAHSGRIDYALENSDSYPMDALSLYLQDKYKLPTHPKPRECLLNQTKCLEGPYIENPYPIGNDDVTHIRTNDRGSEPVGFTGPPRPSVNDSVFSNPDSKYWIEWDIPSIFKDPPALEAFNASLSAALAKSTSEANTSRFSMKPTSVGTTSKTRTTPHTTHGPTSSPKPKIVKDKFVIKVTQEIPGNIVDYGAAVYDSSGEVKISDFHDGIARKAGPLPHDVQMTDWPRGKSLNPDNANIEFEYESPIGNCYPAWNTGQTKPGGNSPEFKLCKGQVRDDYHCDRMEVLDWRKNSKGGGTRRFTCHFKGYK